MYLGELGASLVYKASSKTSRAAILFYRETLSQKNKTTKEKKKVYMPVISDT